MLSTTRYIVSLLLLGLLIPGMALCQAFSCRGTVKDSLTRQSLPNTNIAVTDLQLGTVKHIVTATNGSFLIENLAEGTYILSLAYVGYDSRTVEFSVSPSQPKLVLADQYMSPGGSVLSNVTVSAATAKPFIVQTGEKIVLNIAQSPIAAGGNALDAISRGPGVMEVNGVISFRSRKVAVLIDGKPTNLSGDDLKEMLTNMPATAIDKIEILPSPSAKYDAQGSSIINIKLARNNNYGWNGTLLGGFGSGVYGKFNTGFTLNYKGPRLSVSGGYAYNYNTQYYSTHTSREIKPFSDLTQYENDVRTRRNNAYRLGADYQINKKNSFGLLLKGNSNSLNRNIVQQANLHNSITAKDTLSNTGTAGGIKIFNPSLNFYYKTILDSLGKELVFNIDYFSYDKNWNDLMTTNILDQDAKNIVPEYSIQNNTLLKNRVASFAIDLTAPGRFGKLEAGLKTSFASTDNSIEWLNRQGVYWANDAGRSNQFLYKENINAAYLSFNKTLHETWEITIGARAEQTNTSGTLMNSGTTNSKHYFNVFSNLNLQYISNINSIFHFSYRRDIERFGYAVMNPFMRYQGQYSYSRGNPDVVPEIYNTFDLNFTHHQNLVIGVSYTAAQKVLVPVYLAGENNSIISTIDNLASSHLFYGYINWNKKIKAWTTNFSGGYGFLRLNTGEKDTDKNTWGYLLQWTNGFSFGGWNAEVYASYMSPTALGIYRIGANLMSGAGISKGIGKNTNLKLSVTDLFNTQMQRAQIHYGGVIMREDKKTESRFINLAITYKFGKKQTALKSNKLSKAEELNKRLSD